EFESGRGQPHCYELCQGHSGLFPFFLFFLLNSFFVFSVFPFRPVPRVKTFSWRRQGSGHCSSCYPCTAPKGTAPVDSLGSGPGNERAQSPDRAVASPSAAAGARRFKVARSVLCIELKLRGWLERAGFKLRPCASPDRRAAPVRCASATAPRPTGGPSTRWFYYIWLWWL